MLYSSMRNLDPILVSAIVEKESSYNPNAIGKLGEVGLMQLMPQYFSQSKAELLRPETNIRLGTEYLARARSSCKHTQDFTWVVCYNRGLVKGGSLVNPKADDYYKRVMKIYRRKKHETQDLSLSHL